MQSLHFDTLFKHLNGYCRIMEYGTPHIGKLNISKNYTLSITEGHFKFGKLNGFGRVIDKDAEWTIGFWKNGVPWGKSSRYYRNNIKNEGIYEGKLIKNQTIKSYCVN